jgi:hypothetical protein
MDSDAKKLISEACDFYLNPFTPLLEAMVEAEGGPDAFIKAVKCSMPDVDSFEVALARACKTVRRIADEQAGKIKVFSVKVTDSLDPWTGESTPKVLIVTDEFIDVLASIWAPPNASNDPKGLNRFWSGNVKTLVRKHTLEKGDRK